MSKRGSVDHLNTPRLVANQSGQTVWRWDQQEPFGVNVPDENPSGLGAFDLPLRLPGQYADKETNLHYNYFRDYDASIGRYVESDPIGLHGGINTYAYVRSDPLSLVDPKGLQMGPFPFAGYLDPKSAVCALNPAGCPPPTPSEGECFVRCTLIDLTVGYAAEAAAEQVVHRMTDQMAKATCKVILKGVFYIETAFTLNKCYRICYQCGGQSCPRPDVDPNDPNFPRLPPLTMDPNDPRRRQPRS